MSNENREEILANFQSITGIDDVSEAIQYLEDNNWNITSAIQCVIPLDTTPAAVPILNDFSGATSRDEILPLVTSELGFGANLTNFLNEDVIMTAPSSPQKLINNTNNFTTRTIGTGQSTSRPTASSSTLSSSNLNYNYWNTPTDGGGAAILNNGEIINLCNDDDIVGANKMLEFIVHYKRNMYKIELGEYSTVKDLKTIIAEKVLIPNHRQILTGWNKNNVSKRDVQSDQTILKNLIENRKSDIFVTDSNERVSDDDLCSTSSERPSDLGNNLPLDQSGIDSDNEKMFNDPDRNLLEIDSDSEEFGPDPSDHLLANDDEYVYEPEQPRHNRCFLIPDNIDDERLGSKYFIENYTQRYTDKPHPVFFDGSLEQAYKEACLKSAKDRKLLAIYLHHDDSVLTNVFCSELLGCETILETLSHNFVLYGWDLKYESNKNMLLSSITACIGATVAMNVRNIPVDKLPAIVLIAKVKSQCDILSVIDGNVCVNELLTQLIEAVDSFTDQQRVEIREEEERAARERIKTEQDLEFQKSLVADRAKEEARKHKEMLLTNERNRLESEKAEEVARFEAKKAEAASTLPPEPVGGEGVITIKVATPEGDFIHRRFTACTELRILLNFIVSKGFLLEEYKVIVFPRLDLTTLNDRDTLKSLKFSPQEILRLEQR